MKWFPYECMKWEHIHSQRRTTGKEKFQEKSGKLIDGESSTDWDKKST